jgi:hypothetical protein
MSHLVFKSNVASCTFMMPSGKVDAEAGAIISGPQQQMTATSARCSIKCVE